MTNSGVATIDGQTLMTEKTKSRMQTIFCDVLCLERCERNEYRYDYFRSISLDIIDFLF